MDEGTMIEEVFECIDCGKTVKKIVLIGTDNSNFVCPQCEMGEIDFDED